MIQAELDAYLKKETCSLKVTKYKATKKIIA